MKNGRIAADIHRLRAKGMKISWLDLRISGLVRRLGTSADWHISFHWWSRLVHEFEIRVPK